MVQRGNAPVTAARYGAGRGAVAMNAITPTAPLPPLVADGRTLNPALNRLGRLVPSSPDEDIASLQRTLREQGYLSLRSFLDRDAVLDFRAYCFTQMASAGILTPGSDPRIGLSSGQPEQAALVSRRLMALVRSATYEGFCAQPRLSGFMDA